jgi:hypothetical protein
MTVVIASSATALGAGGTISRRLGGVLGRTEAVGLAMAPLPGNKSKPMSSSGKSRLSSPSGNAHLIVEAELSPLVYRFHVRRMRNG